MKRIWAVLLTAALLAALLAGCKKTPEESPSSEGAASPSPTVTASPSPTAAPSEEDPWLGTWYLDAEKSAAELVNHADLYDMFGSGLRNYGGEVRFEADGSFAATIGINYELRGTYTATAAEAVVTGTKEIGEISETGTWTFVREKEEQQLRIVSEIEGERLYFEK